MIKTGNPSAVAIIETQEAFVLEGRPEATGNIQLAHAGSVQFFGGGIEPGETPEQAIVRELQEELALEVEAGELVWSGWYNNSQNRKGERVRRHVSLFHVLIQHAELRLQVPGSIVRLPKTLEAVDAHTDKLTPFALFGLRRVLEERKEYQDT